MTAAVDETRRVLPAETDTGEPWTATILRAIVHALTALVIAFPLTVVEAMVAAFVLAGIGSTVGRMLARTRVRIGALFGCALLGLAATRVVHEIFVGSSVVAATFGPSLALRLGEAILFGFSALFVSAFLRALSARRRSFAVLEVAVVGVAFAQLLVAHRNGAINRPFEIADPILTRGGDPTVAFLALGALATFVLVLLLLSERSLFRSVLHLALVFMVLLGVLGTTHVMGLPPPPPTGGGLGLRDDPSKSDQKGKGQSNGRRNNEELEFRDNYDADANQVPVAVVLLHDDYSPPTGVYYFRQGAFSQFNGRRLVGATRDDVDRDIAPGFPAGKPLMIPDAPPGDAFRFTFETTVALLADHTRPFVLEAPVRLEPAPNHNPARFRRIYKATSASLTSDYTALLGREAGSTKWTKEQWAHYTAVPTDPRYGDLTKKVLAERAPPELDTEPIVQAVAIASYLGGEGKYSLNSRHADAADPTASFLFGDMTGYCVHFAHAATYMMRSAGIPARVATGYAIPESARQGGSAILVTGQSSHAWPEIYMEDVGWVIVDVTPETVLDPPPPPPDPDLQRLLAELLRNEKPIAEDGKSTLPELADAARGLGRTLALGFAVIFLVVLIGLVFAKIWRRVAPRFAKEPALPRVAYRAVLDACSDVGLVREPGESREAFAERIRTLSPSFRALTDRHVGATFGSRRALRDLRGLAVSAANELARAVPRKRRALGLLAPWTWLRSR